MKSFKWLFAFLLLLPLASYGQKEGTDFILGFEHQKYTTLQIGLAHAKRTDLIVKYSNIHLCGNLLFGNAGPTAFGINAGGDFSFLIYQAGIQIAGYGNNTGNVVLLRPEIGVTVFGLCDLLYGYNFFLVKENFNISNNTISFRFKIPLALYK